MHNIYRVTIVFEGSCPLESVEPCTPVVRVEKNHFCELWIRCSNPSDILLIIKKALEKGLLTLWLGFPNGNIVKTPFLNLEKIAAYSSSSLKISGIIELEYYTHPKEWIKYINAKKITIYPKQTKAIAHLEKHIETAQLFDLGLRLLKPQRIPP